HGGGERHHLDAEARFDGFDLVREQPGHALSIAERKRCADAHRLRVTSSNSASYSPRGPKVGPIPTMRRSHPRTRSRSRETYGCSAVIDCSAATAQWRPTLRACSVASRRTLWSPTRPTALITTRLGAIRPADRLLGRPSGLRPARSSS